jgi:hypothetical protein
MIEAYHVHLPSPKRRGGEDGAANVAGWTAAAVPWCQTPAFAGVEGPTPADSTDACPVEGKAAAQQKAGSLTHAQSHAEPGAPHPDPLTASGERECACLSPPPTPVLGFASPRMRGGSSGAAASIRNRGRSPQASAGVAARPADRHAKGPGCGRAGALAAYLKLSGQQAPGALLLLPSNPGADALRA